MVYFSNTYNKQMSFLSLNLSIVKIKVLFQLGIHHLWMYYIMITDKYNAHTKKCMYRSSFNTYHAILKL